MVSEHIGKSLVIVLDRGPVADDPRTATVAAGPMKLTTAFVVNVDTLGVCLNGIAVHTNDYQYD